MNYLAETEIKMEISDLIDLSNKGNTSMRLVDRGIGDGRVNQYYREGYTEELEKELKTLKQKMGGQTKAIQSKNAKIEELKDSLKKKIFDLKALKSKSHEKNIIKSHLDKHCTAAQTRKLLNPDFNHQRKYEESDFILAAALKSMSPEAYRLIRRKSILSIPGKTALNKWLKEHKEYAGLFVGCRKETENGEESDEENLPDFVPEFSTNNSQLKAFLEKVPDKIDVNVKSEVGGSIIQLKKKSFVQCIDYYDNEIGKEINKSEPNAISLALALLREAMFALGSRDIFYPKLELGTMLLHLTTRTEEHSGLLRYFKVVEREAGKENIKWRDTDLIIKLQEKILERANSSQYNFDPSILPECMRKDDEMIVTDMEGNQVLLTYVDISGQGQGVPGQGQGVPGQEQGVPGQGQGVQVVQTGPERSAVEGMVQLSAENMNNKKTVKRKTLSNENSRAEDLRLKKRMKRNDVIKEFGDVDVNFDARIQCHICTEKLDSHVLQDLHLFTVHQQETVCQICKAENTTYEDYLNHSKMHTYTCEHCAKLFKNKMDLNKHLDLLHLPCQCPVCLKVCVHKHGLSSHITQSHKASKNVKEIRCTLCQFKTLSRVELVSHLQTCHVKKSVQDSSKVKVSSKNNGEKTTNLFTCSICDKVFANSNILEKHIKSIHGVSQYKCSMCSFITPDVFYLREHMKNHQKPKPVEGKVLKNLSATSSTLLPEFRITGTEVRQAGIDSDAVSEFTVTTVEVNAANEVVTHNNVLNQSFPKI